MSVASSEEAESCAVATDWTEKRFRRKYGFKGEEKKPIAFKDCLIKLFVPTKKSIFKFLPVLKWLPRYNFKSLFLSDLITGLTIGTMQIPQGMAYAALGGVLPVYGLYTGFFPVLLYTVFGTSRHLSVGSYALTSIMIGSHLDGILPLPIVNEHSNHSSNQSALLESVYYERILHANAITFFMSLFLIVFGILRLGFLTRLFARPFQSGFIFGVSFVTMLSQWKHLLGVKVRSYSGPLSVIWILRDLCVALVTTLNSDERYHVISSVITSFICIVFLIAVKHINENYKKKYFRNIPIPGEVIVIAFGTLISWAVDLEENHGIYVVGPIASGLPSPQFPKAELISTVFVQSFLVAIVGYSVVVSLAQAFAEKERYKVDTNQELFAFGFCNLFGSLFLCLPSFSSMSRSCVQFESGGKTQIVGWISALMMLFVLLFIGHLFQFLPKACLASIVVVAIGGLFKNIYDLKRYWTNHKMDSVTWIVTCVGTILLDVTWGLVCGLTILLLSHVVQTSNVKLRVLQNIDGTQIYREKGLYQKTVSLDKKTIVVRFDGPLNFFNSKKFRKSIVTSSGVDPILNNPITSYSKTPKKVIQTQRSSELCLKTVESDYDSGQSNAFQDQLEENELNSNVELKMIVLDCSRISTVDSVGANALTKVIMDYRNIGVEFCLANCCNALLESLPLDDILDVSFVSISGALKSFKEAKNIETHLVD